MNAKILKLIASASVGAAVMAFAGASQAAMALGAETIVITSAYTGGDSYLQVSELQALNWASSDVALASDGATASAPDTWQQFNGGVSTAPVNAIDGVIDGNYNDGTIFHSGTTGGYENLTVTLAAPTNLTGLGIFGRTDCCSARDIYNVTIFNVNGAVIYSGVLDATNPDNFASVSFSVPEPATWAMMLVGFGGLGAVLRTQRRKQALVAA